MICSGDTVSGTGKRESQSEAFSKAPFTYYFTPIPLSQAGWYFIDSPSIQFSVNKTCNDLDMTNEFMRFLITRQELNKMASSKRLAPGYADDRFGLRRCVRAFQPGARRKGSVPGNDWDH